MPKNLIQNALGFTILLVLISGCSTTKTLEEIEVKTVPVEKPKLSLPESDEVRMKSVEWIVVTPDNQEQVFREVKEKSGSSAIFSLDVDSYKDLSRNLNEVRRYLEQQEAVIRAYERYYVKSNSVLDKSVTLQ